MSANKKNKGQFYTTNASYILSGISIPLTNVSKIVEPFAGKGDLIDWIKEIGCDIPVVSYDIEPKRPDIFKQDTLLCPPDYKDALVITNPPYLARNKSNDKHIYDLYNTNDLYKCFMKSISSCAGGIILIPAGFFLSPRDIDSLCRSEFMKRFRLIKVKYFEETVFDDTTTTIVAIVFERSDVILTEQTVEWVLSPSMETKFFKMTSENNWIIGGDIYNINIPKNITVRRHVDGMNLRECEQQTFITLNALDSGKQIGRISFDYKKDYVYPAKESSRTYATIRISGINLTDDEQIEICKKCNEFIEHKREETWSLFLPQYRESKEYARKRIPFELAYKIMLYTIGKHFDM